MPPAFIVSPLCAPSHLLSHVHPRLRLPSPRVHARHYRAARLLRAELPLQPATPSSPPPSDFTPLVPYALGSLETDQTASALDPSFAGGSGDSGPGGSGGGGGGEGESAGDAGDEDALSALLSRENAVLADVPADILAAYRTGYVGLDAVANFFSASRNWLSRILMGSGSGMRNRFLADKLFLLKILIEEGIGVFGKLSAEYEQRRSDFWKQGEFVFANLITAILADFALVYLPAPSVALTRATGKGFGAWLANLSTTLPSNIFQTDRAFTMAQRAGGFALKGSQLFVVGMLCCFTGVIVTNSLVFIREKLDKKYVPKTEKQNPLLVSLLYATFLGISSGSRYQLVNGVESHIFPRIFATAPRIVEEASTFLLRYGNTFWGSQQWVMFCRFTNVQKSKAK